MSDTKKLIEEFRVCALHWKEPYSSTIERAAAALAAKDAEIERLEEIIAWRESMAVPRARTEALEEAAKLIIDRDGLFAKDDAAAIRALGESNE